MEALRKFKSKRNEVFLAKDGEALLVIKRYARTEDEEWEKAVYYRLSGSNVPTPSPLPSPPGELRLSYVEGITFDRLLEEQERTGEADLLPWEKLAQWLCLFRRESGLLMEDCNLRNFILDQEGQVWGLDFEQCREEDALTMLGSICAFVRLYDPQETPLKMSISRYLQEKLSELTGIDIETLAEETEHQRNIIIERRLDKRIASSASAIILAGGKSSRMGRCKAELPWEGRTLIGYQAEKLRAAGIRDIIVSGYSSPVPGARYVPDVYPGKGPLAGIHAGLQAAENPSCFVLSVDAPLFSAEDIKALLSAHFAANAQITVVEHGGILEPLIGVYNSSLSHTAGNILQGTSTSVKRLLDLAGFAAWEVTDEGSVRGCNTPEEYNELRSNGCGID